MSNTKCSIAADDNHTLEHYRDPGNFGGRLEVEPDRGFNSPERWNDQQADYPEPEGHHREREQVSTVHVPNFFSSSPMEGKLS